jgi:hypothetical protein
MLATRVLKLMTEDEYMELREQFLTVADSLSDRRLKPENHWEAFKAWLRLPGSELSWVASSRSISGRHTAFYGANAIQCNEGRS